MRRLECWCRSWRGSCPGTLQGKILDSALALVAEIGSSCASTRTLTQSRTGQFVGANGSLRGDVARGA